MKTPTPIIDYDPSFWGATKVPKFRDADRAWKFLRKHGFRRLPPAVELVFLKDLQVAVNYARRVGTRLPVVFEDEIKKIPQLSFDYVHTVLHSPCEDFEESISSDPKLLVRYAVEVVEGPLPSHLEDRLMGDPYACFEYAWCVLDGRLPENLHNFMFCANLNKENYGRRYRGMRSKVNGTEEYDPDYVSPDTYFEFIKWQRKNLHRQIAHYQKIYQIENNQTVAEFLYELEHGR